ncbi:MAG: LamG-like jellyroll fold domain-containing protein [Alphaproteobacteria bacterium]
MLKKNFKTIKQSQAFSLIELSIVILIIGILVAGVTQSSRLVRQIRLTVAQSMTRSSEVSAIADLAFWAETTLDNSVINSAGSSQIDDGNSILTWNDSKFNNSFKINVSQSNASLQPTFKADGINGLPSINFNGVNQTLFSSPTSPLPASDKNYSLVAVWRSNNNSSIDGRQIVGQTTNPVSFDRLGSIVIQNPGTIGFSGWANNYFPTSVLVNTNYITIISVNNNVTTNNISVYNNSNTASTGSSQAPANLNLGSGLFYIGGNDAVANYHFSGLISEILVFDRFLKPDEIRAVNGYLSKKYAIKIN